ncbi:Zn-ribbon domain-containing OB-fold protein [Phytohabitans kaempferiae]|uniref:Zn-ribbon domain-containing OB-fold protein n=1 Tax=Phytohabitans kaempferiae TaxID=1620943 RepID=A0ABV6MHF5_9ACTN
MADLTKIPVPDVTDPLFAPYWDGTAKGELVLPACGGCAAVVWPPRGLCPACGSTERKWESHEPAGTLYTFTVVGHATVPGYTDLPYAVAIVELADAPGVRVIGSVDGDPDPLRIGMPMRAVFRPAGEDGEIVVLCWQPVYPQGES